MSAAVYYPGLWLPTGHIIVHRVGAKGEVKHLPCPPGAFGRLIDFFDAIGREPLTLAAMEEVIDASAPSD